MKADRRTCFLTLGKACTAAWILILLSPPLSSVAIPNQVGGGGFFNLAGMRFEDFAARPETWNPGAKLKATWELWKSPEVTKSEIEVLRLTVSATIFGLSASEVTVERTDEQILRFHAVFRPARESTLAQLEQSLRSNLEAWSDSAEGDQFQGGASAISLTPRASEGDLLVTFSAAASAATTTVAR
jgi:hypothetical protein